MMLAMVLLPTIKLIGRTRGKSGGTLCGLTEATPGSEEEEEEFPCRAVL
jgi:hypothetical protein